MDDKYDKIEDYLKGNLSAEERRFFEEERETDRALAEEVDLVEGLMAATGEEDIIVIDGLVQDALGILEAAEKPSSKTKGSSNDSSWWWKLLLVLLVMGGLSLLTYYYLSTPKEVSESTLEQELPQDQPTNNSVQTEEDTILEAVPLNEPTEENPPILEIETEEEPEKELPDDIPYAQDETPTQTLEEENQPEYRLLAMAEIDRVNFKGLRNRSNDGQAISVIDSAWRLFEEEQFVKTLDHLSSGEPAEMDVTELTFLRAMSHLMLQNFSLAAPEFKQITSSFSRGYDAEWYRLVALTAQLPATREAYEEQLSTILSTASHPHLEKAKKLSGQVVLE